MRVGFLGTAHAVSMRDRDNTSLIVESNDVRILVDCSGNAWGKLLKMGYDPTELDAVFITHGHIDHVYGLPSLLAMMKFAGRTRPLSIYVGSDYLDQAEKLLGLFEELKDTTFDMRFVNMDYEISSFEIGDLTVETFPVNHTLRNVALKFHDRKSSMVYSSDTAFHKPLADFARGCDVLVHEATFSTKLGDTPKEGHSTPSDAATIAKMAEVKRLFLVHIGPSIAEDPEAALEEAQSAFSGEVVISSDLEIYEI